LNKRRRGELVHRGGFMNDEAAARAINAEPWESLPGMVKKRCSQCHYWFAVLAAEAEATSRCPDCAGLGTRSAPA
jgi:hypothetical protein